MTNRPGRLQINLSHNAPELNRKLKEYNFNINVALRVELKNYADLIKSELIKLSDKRFISRKQAERMGYPYARRHWISGRDAKGRFIKQGKQKDKKGKFTGAIKGAPPAYIINKQSGKFVSKWRVFRVYNKGDYIICYIANTAKYSKYMYGTSKMIKRSGILSVATKRAERKFGKLSDRLRDARNKALNI